MFHGILLIDEEAFDFERVAEMAEKAVLDFLLA